MSEWTLRKPFVVAFYGTSLTTGRLSTRWVERLAGMFSAYPECVGPFLFQNMGKGSQTSDWGVANMGFIADLNPTHILSESFAINDSALVSGSPQVSRANHLVNMQAMHDAWKARNAAVDITWQTMNGVSAAGAALRPALPDYYADDVTQAAVMGDRMLDNYAGAVSPPGIAGGWPKPLPDALTDNGDGLHPIAPGGTDVYLLPNALYWLRLRAAEHWGLPAPSPPEPPPLSDAEYLIAAGAGGGGPTLQFGEEGSEFWVGGGGGGAGGRKRGGPVYLADLFGPVIIGQGSPAGSYFNGTLSQIGANKADGGGGGAPAGKDGRPGASGGGASCDGGSARTGGAGDVSQGSNGGAGAVGVPGGAGGGGATGAGQANNAGRQGGAGSANDVPGEAGSICAGGPGGTTASPLAYLAGAGPANPGGGGRGGDSVSGSVPDAGGDGAVWVWYPGEPRATGGAISSADSATVHKFVFADMQRPAPMTGPAAPAGLAASADSSFGGFNPWAAFRNLAVPGRAWASANSAYPHWLQQTNVVPRRVTAYSLAGYSDSSGVNGEFLGTPYTWELRGSNNNFATYDVVDARTAEVATRQNLIRTYRVAAPGLYSAYRLHVTAGQPGGDAYCEIAMLSFWECPELQPL